MDALLNFLNDEASIGIAVIDTAIAASYNLDVKIQSPTSQQTKGSASFLWSLCIRSLCESHQVEVVTMSYLHQDFHRIRVDPVLELRTL
jgi:hypothetical protein